MIAIALHSYLLTDCATGPFTMMTSSNGTIFRVTGPLCGEFTGPCEFPTQRPVTRSFDVFFDRRLNKRLSNQPWGRWFETPSWSLWRCNENSNLYNWGDGDSLREMKCIGCYDICLIFVCWKIHRIQNWALVTFDIAICTLSVRP